MDRAVRSWLAHLDVEKGASRHTLAAYRRDLDRWVGFLVGNGVVDPRQVTESQVGEFLALLREGDDTH
ncbi:MAG: site-specific integrase, partial [Phycicoccus sp.]